MPNFYLRDGPCSFYSGTKALGEIIQEGGPQLHLAVADSVDEFDSPRNYLSKVQRYAKAVNVNWTFVGGILRRRVDLWQLHAPFGIYDVTNPGWVTARQVVALVERYLKPARFRLGEVDEGSRWAAQAPRSKLCDRPPAADCRRRSDCRRGAGGFTEELAAGDQRRRRKDHEVQFRTRLSLKQLAASPTRFLSTRLAGKETA